MEKKKLTISDLLEMKKRKEKIVLLSVPDAATASIAERAGVDIVGLGDSLGMVTLGYPSTLPVTMDDMIRHGKAVRRGAPNTFMIGAMPYQSYRTPEMALDNAVRFIQEVGVDAVKIQGGKKTKHIIKALTDAGIPCLSHVGLAPHYIPQFGGFKVQGKTSDSAIEIYENALAIQEAGAFGMEIEAVPPPIAEQIAKDVDILVYGIGAGIECDGQVLVGWDMLGLFDSFKPKFVKRYANLAKIAIEAISEFVYEVRERKFPTEEYTYSINEKELQNFRNYIKEQKNKS